MKKISEFPWASVSFVLVLLVMFIGPIIVSLISNIPETEYQPKEIMNEDPNNEILLKELQAILDESKEENYKQLSNKSGISIDQVKQIIEGYEKRHSSNREIDYPNTIETSFSKTVSELSIETSIEECKVADMIHDYLLIELNFNY